MANAMTWSEAKAAGFALAAWLADDRELLHVADALGAGEIAQVRARVVAPNDTGAAPVGSARSKAESVQRLLITLRPALDERVLGLPVRVRTLLARFAPAGLRKQLLRDTLPARAHYQPDEELLAVLLRAARNDRGSRVP